MQIITLHGRKNPEENMPDWGFDGPTIKGIKAVHWTYGNYVAHFDTKQSAQVAHQLTGWPFFDDNALSVSFFEDLLLLHPAGDKPSTAYPVGSAAYNIW